MDNFNTLQNQFNTQSREAITELSALFMELVSKVEDASTKEILRPFVDSLFKKWMQHNQAQTSTVNKLFQSCESSEKMLQFLKEEKRRLEALYTSGISFTAITELQPLLETAMRTIVKELSADAGFILLTDAKGQVTRSFAHNMELNEKSNAHQLSMSVVNETLKKSKPINMDGADDALYKAHSVINLGITSALCVPLLKAEQGLGVVYLDRRDIENAFNEADLIFLMSFARQIVQALDISNEISTLEEHLIEEANLKMSDIRKLFKSEGMIGNSNKLFELLKIAHKISPTNAPVVILGENGTGKEVLARAIHNNSRRAEKPFVAINCSAIPEDLLESELFGYESGAFTGAAKSKPGKFEHAQGGTIFLDEIGDMSMNLQAKLLRVLQTHEFERLGSVKTQKLDVRILAATNRKLSEQIKNGHFREDLYYRLKVVELTLPPLRERKEDIADLVQAFLKKHAQEGKVLGIAEEALLMLEGYEWPGNIRELENIILRGVVLAKSGSIQADELPQEILSHQNEMASAGFSSTLAKAEEEFRRLYVLKTLRNSSSKAEAAKKLGINRTHFYRILTQLNIT